MLLGFVLGRLLEENLRRAMLIARGDATVFIDYNNHKISLFLLVTAALLLLTAVLPMIRRRREEVFVE
jgi:putative tricarboxylic transport membrane protein